MCKCKCKGAASSKGPRGLRGLKGDSGDSETPKMYELSYYDNSAYDLNISTMGANCLGCIFNDVSLSSITMPSGNNVFNFIQLINTVIVTPLSVDFSLYTQIKKILFQTTDVDIDSCNIESSMSLESFIVYYSTGGAFSIGNMLSPVLEVLVFSGTEITSLGNVTILTSYSVTTNTGIITIGNLTGLSSGACYIATNVALTTIGNITNNNIGTAYTVYINGNTLLTTIGSFTNNVFAGAATLAITNNPALTTIGSFVGTTITSTAANSLDFRANALSAATISQILVDFDANGQSNKKINFSGGTNAALGSLTVAGAAARTSLLGKGWTITMN